MTTRDLAADVALTRGSSSRPLLAAAGVAVVTAALRLHDPHQTGTWGLCPLRAVTGLDCPGCGGLRAVNDLTHGDLGAAAASNLFFVVSIPLVLALWAVWFWRSRTPASQRRPMLRPATTRLLVTGYLIALVAFTVFRNTPWGHSLYV